MLNIIIKLLFWLSFFLLVYHYVLFPIILKIISKFKKLNFITDYKYKPKLSILIAAHNEEDFIRQKIVSIQNSNYELSKLEILIGSDASTDSTNIILGELMLEYPNIKTFFFEDRKGKPEIINQLATHATSDLLVITDANVILRPETITELVKYFADDRIGLVDTKMLNFSTKQTGISVQESSYNKLENFIKSKESESFGYMMGPFGGCFAIKKDLFKPVPEKFLVDDFFINMNVLSKGYYTIHSPKAIVEEDIGNDIISEFNRKKRIGTGNFQNLFYFKNLVFNKKLGLSFLFWSHKIIRWFSFIFIITLLLSSLALYNETNYRVFFYVYLLSIFATIIDVIFRHFSKDILLLRFITHFYAMNIALFIGFVNYLKGVKSNVWQPTKRNQTQ